MPCPSSGEIKISDLVTEFGGTAPHALSEYYRNAGLVPGNNTDIPESGEIKLTNCYSAVNEIQHTHSDGDTHADYGTIFGSNWASTVPKRVIVPSGVTVGGTSTHAMNLPTGMGGTIVFDITGNVYGAGGAANGGNGGNAINCVQTTGVTINLNSGGNIKAGGGGGGQGGTGGAGGNGGAGGAGGQGRGTLAANGVYGDPQAGSTCNHSSHNSPCSDYHGRWISGGYSHKWSARTGATTNCTYVGQSYTGDANYRGTCTYYEYYSGGAGGAGGTSGGAGGAGGAGGVGQGYNQTNASGSSGSAGSAGGAGASGASGSNGSGNGGAGGAKGQGGTGGTGATGGTFGNSGGTGTAGSSGSAGTSGSSGSNGNYQNGSGGSGGSAGASGASGSAGGAAGYYITNRGSITFNNSGTVAGQ